MKINLNKIVLIGVEQLIETKRCLVNLQKDFRSFRPRSNRTFKGFLFLRRNTAPERGIW